MHDTYHQVHIEHLRRALAAANRAKEKGNHPFGAILVDENNVVILEAENTVNSARDCTAHAETNLIRQASQQFDPATLRQCTLYTSTEPCAMCAGAIHWGGVSRVVYGLSETSLYDLVGNYPDDETLHLPCREVFAHSGRPIEVIGTLLEDEAKTVHAGFWT
jgi:tRNA(Arg) A34 adenosine deaminase TadA